MSFPLTLPQPVVGPDEKEVDKMNEKVLQALKVDLANFKDANFPTKTGRLKAETTMDVTGGQATINAPEYLQYLEKGALLQKLMTFLEQKYVEHFEEEKRRLEV